MRAKEPMRLSLHWSYYALNLVGGAGAGGRTIQGDALIKRSANQ